MDNELNSIVARAQYGAPQALEELVRRIQDQVHRLAMRMLVNPDDAMEATQEILILIVTKLSTFEGRSAFTTWVYRVAANYLLSAKKIREKDVGLTFETFREDLHEGLITDPAPPADDLVMLNGLRISCTMAMLLCLDPKHRIAYVLGDILELEHAEAAEALGLSKANYRQRLSRARRAVVAFTRAECGLANGTAKCACHQRLPAALKKGRIDKHRPAFGPDNAPAYRDVVKKAAELEGELQVLTLQRAMPPFDSPADLAEEISRIVGADA